MVFVTETQLKTEMATDTIHHQQRRKDLRVKEEENPRRS